jgi:membrane associated rhomboid family serine protease
VLLNAVWLAAFGSPVARRVGAPRLLALAAAGAVGGALAHVLANPHAIGPMIGASAAVSGLMAAAARFVFAPPTVHEDIDRFLPPHLKPRESLRGLLANRRAALFIGIWFVTNALFGIFAEPLGLVDSGIAWEAHMGGFVAGLLLFPLLDPVPDRRRADLGA